MAFQTVSPIYTKKLGRLGAAGMPRSHMSDQPLSDPVHLQGQLWQVTPPPTSFGAVRAVRVGALGQAGEEALGPGGWTIATVIGAGMGGSIIGFVASKGNKEGVYRGGFFSAALAALGASLGHLREDKNKLFGASLLLGSLWTMGWALRPLMTSGGDGRVFGR